MCNSVSFKMSGGVFRNIKKKKRQEKNVVKNITHPVFGHTLRWIAWLRNEQWGLLKKKKNAGEYLFVCFPTGVITDRKKCE